MAARTAVKATVSWCCRRDVVALKDCYDEEAQHIERRPHQGRPPQAGHQVRLPYISQTCGRPAQTTACLTCRIHTSVHVHKAMTTAAALHKSV